MSQHVFTVHLYPCACPLVLLTVCYIRCSHGASLCSACERFGVGGALRLGGIWIFTRYRWRADWAFARLVRAV